MIFSEEQLLQRIISEFCNERRVILQRVTSYEWKVTPFMIRHSFLLHKQQKFYKQNVDCFHGSRVIPSCVAMPHFWRWLGQKKTTKNSDIKTNFEKSEKPSLKRTRIEKIFCDKMIYLLPGNIACIYNRI